MFFTLHRYIFRELLKVFVPASIALTLILSLGSILQPVQEHGVGPRQVLTFMGCSLPITLTFVLPMAALFASALVYGRFANDNELDACRASGISLPTLVYPGLALAIAVAIANLILSFHMLPYFVHVAEKSLKADARQILFRNIERRGFYAVPPEKQWLIYADHVDPESGTLVGVVVADAAGAEIQKIYTADRARVKFNMRDRFNEVQITVEDTTQIGPKDEGSFSVERGVISTEFGSLLGDAIKFKKIDEMKRIKADLMRFRPVERDALNVYAQFTISLLAEDIESKVVGDPSKYYRLHSGDKLVEFRASSVEVADERLKLSGEIVVIESDARREGSALTFRPVRASLHIEGNKLAPTLTMDLRSALVEGTGDLKMRHIIRGLIPPNDVDIRYIFQTEDVLEAIKQATASSIVQVSPKSRLARLQATLERRLRKTLVQIQAEIQSRLVFGIGCVPMILIGIGLGIIGKGGHLLTAFGASCVPAAVLVVCIIGGKQVIENLGAQSIFGMALIWSGLVFLLALAGVIYHRLLKN